MMMVNLEMVSFVLNQPSSHGIMDEGKKRQVGVGFGVGVGVGVGVGDRADALSSASSEVSSVVSSDDSDLFDEVNSPTSETSASSSGELAPQISEPLQDMSSLLQELPFKRGLSQHYNGKSQSFTSLANVRSFEDLAKPENPYNKKLKSCKIYGGLMESHGSSPQPAARGNSSRLMSKKASRGSCSSLCVKRNSSFIANRPPIPPPLRSTSTSSFSPQTPLFALGV